MKLISKLNTRRAKNKKMIRWALFYCKYCNEKIEKPYFDGLRAKSCGCMHNELTGLASKIHGDTCRGQITRLYRIWNNIKARCYNKNNHHYKYYGKRSIKICDQWKNNYIMFKEWALSHGYRDNLIIERKDNDSDYKPLNCKWATYKEQARNRRDNILTMKKVQQIRSLYNNIKISQKLLGNIFGVSAVHIGNIVNNRKWIN